MLRRRFMVSRRFLSFVCVSISFVMIFLTGTVVVSPDDVVQVLEQTRAYLTNKTAVVAEDLAPEVSSWNPDIIAPLERYCQDRTWHEGLYFSCFDSAGGLGNVHGIILDCVRFALEAGAVGLVLPKIQLRNANLESGILREGLFAPFDYMFDEEWSKRTLTASCPRMKVYDAIDDVPNFSSAHFPDPLAPLDLHPGQTFFNYKVPEFEQDILNWLDHPPSSAHLTLVRLRPSVFEIPTSNDPPDLFASFGSILKIHRRFHDLAEKILTAMNSLSATRDRGYLGVHLRVEKDLTQFAADWPSYETQRNSSFATAKAQDLQAMYVASGDGEALDRLRSEAAVAEIVILTKYDLLDPPSLAELHALSFDQQGIVDYLVLLNSTYFVGTAPSTFSYAVAYSRHRAFEGASHFRFPEDKSNRINGADFAFCSWGMWPMNDFVQVQKRVATQTT